MIFTLIISILFIIYISHVINSINKTTTLKKNDRQFGGHQFFDTKKIVNFNESENNNKSTLITYIDDYGYRRFNDSNKLVSHWVVEKYVRRQKLLPGQVVHHIDGNKLNNKPSNLQVFNSQLDHDRHHQNQYKYNGTWHSEVPEYSNY